jgi:class 3 adenylate cyclase
LARKRGDGPSEAVVKSLLFADVADYSRLSDSELEKFATKTLYDIRDCIGKPWARNTWGDGIFLVYDEPHACAEAALKLRDLFRNTDWRARGYSQGLGIRIALSVARVFVTHDPIRGAVAVFGRQVSRTARLEPIVGAGEVLCLESMRTLLTDTDTIKADLVGKKPLPKNWGDELVYRLRWHHEAEQPAAMQGNAEINASPLVGRQLKGYLGEGVVESVLSDGTVYVKFDDSRVVRIEEAKAKEWLIPED